MNINWNRKNQLMKNFGIKVPTLNQNMSGIKKIKRDTQKTNLKN